MTVDPKSRVQPSFLLQLWVRTALDDSARVAGNWIRDSRTDLLVFQLVWSSLWTEMTLKNELIIRECASLVAQKKIWLRVGNKLNNFLLVLH